MQMNNESVLEAARALPTEERADLIEKLIESLEEDRAEIDAAWVEEAERRLQAFHEGRLGATPADEVFRSLGIGDET